MEIEGMIIRDLGETGGTSKAGNLWQKHEWVMETLGQYPRRVKFHVFGEKSKTLTFEAGKQYVFQFDLESREFNERWYTDVSVYAARPIEAGAVQNTGSEQRPQFGGQTASEPASNPFGTQATSFQPQAPAANPFSGADFSQGDSSEDLPF